MRSYKSTIGGACSALGTVLMGVGVVPMVSNGQSSEMLGNIALAGFFISAIGTFFAHFFSADKSEVKRMMEINEDYADTRFETKKEAESDRRITKAMLRGKQDVKDK